MIDAAGQAILHTTVAALVVEALLRLWRVDDPGERLAMRWVEMAAPVLLTTACLAFFPWRSAPWFTERWALFAGGRWNELSVGGVGLATAATAALAAIGTALYLRDALPFLADRVARHAPDHGLPGSHPACQRAQAAFADTTGPALKAPPAITVIDVESPVLLCTGIGRTTIVVSTGTLARLDDAQLAAAFAHEVAHLRRRDPIAGWWLMAARTVQFFNPVVQVVARQAVQELERRADVEVVAAGRAQALAAAMQRLSHAAESHSDLACPPADRLPDRVFSSAHRHAIDGRCRLLLERRLPARRPFRAWRVVLSGAGLAALLFLVT